ncbi:trypsin-like peptidase domain-containing protein [Opitutales bacterium]|nr:trypsin-like peptidase domain-containing protein [Opitutales bacterium]MDC1022881.1 trypsin-like peptidase domain-containing protein [bacterium]
MTEQKYKLLWRGKESGPYTPSEIRQLWESQKINGAYQVVLDSGLVLVEEFLPKFEEEKEIEISSQTQLLQTYAAAESQRQETALIEAERLRQQNEQLNRKQKLAENHSGKKYFLFINNQKKGPFTQKAIQIQIDGGKADSNTMIWTEEVGDWVQLSGYSEFDLSEKSSNRKIFTGIAFSFVLVLLLLGAGYGYLKMEEIKLAERKVQATLQNSEVEIVEKTDDEDNKILVSELDEVISVEPSAKQGTDEPPAVLEKDVHSESSIDSLNEEIIKQKVAFVVCGWKGITMEGEKVERYDATGSGFLVNQNGYIFTNQHVVEDVDNDSRAKSKIEEFKTKNNFEEVHPTVWVFFGEDEKYQAEIIHVSEKYDFAILKAKGLRNKHYFNLSSSDKIKRGTKVYTLGFPGKSGVLTEGEEHLKFDKKGVQDFFSKSDFGYVQKAGEVSVVKNTLREGTVIEHDASINAGNSGGPLADKYGTVHGINTWGAASKLQQLSDGKNKKIKIDVAHGIFFSLSIAQLRTEIMKNDVDVTWE